MILSYIATPDSRRFTPHRRIRFFDRAATSTPLDRSPRFQVPAQARAQSQVKINQGACRKATKMRFGDFAAEWLRDYAKANVRERTYETYESALRNHLVPHFGDLLLTQLTRKLIDAFVAQRSACLEFSEPSTPTTISP
jgi:hypothetical protein